MRDALRHGWALSLCIILLCVGAYNVSHSQAQSEQAKAVPREIIAVYDGQGQFGHNIRQNMIHRFYEMPMNHLGYVVKYHDIHKPLPEMTDQIHGIIVYFDEELTFDENAFVKWLYNAGAQGKRLILIGDIGISDLTVLSDEARELHKKVHAYAGVLHMNDWYLLTTDTKLSYIDPDMMDFERKITAPYPPFVRMLATPKGTPHLKAIIDENSPKDEAHLVVTGPQGGFISPEYDYHEQEISERFVTLWHVNPFNFLERALGSRGQPAADITTHLGKRIFYSHIDGDGWNNLARIEGYDSGIVAASDVILKKIIRPYSDFGFSVGLVVGDLVDGCFGSEKSRDTASSTLKEKNVEPTSHTYTHPLYWQFFEDYSKEKEAPYASAYPRRAGLFAQDYKAVLGAHNHPKETPRIKRLRTRKYFEKDAVDFETLTPEEEMLQVYDTPRSYNCVAFDEHNEIVGASEVINSLAPPEKKVKLIQWSGNTSPYERFLKKVREAGMLNINGGESRFDPEYPSYSSIFPIGVQVGSERQIYSSASNENTYTNLWSERFFGYRYLIQTVESTDKPRRIAPFNVYFHSYSGERPASLRALEEVMEYARNHSVIPLYTSEFTAIANGFFTVKFDQIGQNRWRVKDRGALQTVRFDGRHTQHVDFSRSHGVLGYNTHEEKLYVTLNPSVKEPVIALSDSQEAANDIFIVESRMHVTAAKRSDAALQMELEGFGDNTMRFRVADDGRYRVTLARKGESSPYHVSDDYPLKRGQMLDINFDKMIKRTPVMMRVEKL